MFKSVGECTRVPTKKEEDPATSTFVYDCELCEEGGWCSETEVVIHKQIHHSAQIDAIVKKNYSTTCLACTNTFPNKKMLISHYKTMHLYSSPQAQRVEREIFICDHCEQIFFNKPLFAMHVALKHMQSLKIECPLCSKVVKRGAVWRHVESHQLHSVSVCPICLIKCKNRFLLHKHMETHMKNYNCTICGFETNKQSNFNFHIQRYMEEVAEQDYNNLAVTNYCLKPNKNTSWRTTVSCFGLNGTMLVCPLYICVLCRHICTRKKLFKQHIYLAHKKVRPQPGKVSQYRCFCGEEFSTNILLKQHVFKLKEPHRDMKKHKQEMDVIDILTTNDIPEYEIKVKMINEDDIK